jgi:hypothetical protein
MIGSWYTPNRQESQLTLKRLSYIKVCSPEEKETMSSICSQEVTVCFTQHICHVENATLEKMLA